MGPMNTRTAVGIGAVALTLAGDVAPGVVEASQAYSTPQAKRGRSASTGRPATDIAHRRQPLRLSRSLGEREAGPSWMLREVRAGQATRSTRVRSRSTLARP